MAFNYQARGIQTESICAPAVIAPPNSQHRGRDGFGGLEEGDPILVQTPAGICEQGVFLRVRDDFLVWVRNVKGTTYIALTGLEGITITRL